MSENSVPREICLRVSSPAMSEGGVGCWSWPCEVVAFHSIQSSHSSSGLEPFFSFLAEASIFDSDRMLYLELLPQLSSGTSTLAEVSCRWAQWTKEKVGLLAVNGCHFDTSSSWNPISMPTSIFPEAPRLKIQSNEGQFWWHDERLPAKVYPAPHSISYRASFWTAHVAERVCSAPGALALIT